MYRIRIPRYRPWLQENFQTRKEPEGHELKAEVLHNLQTYIAPGFLHISSTYSFTVRIETLEMYQLSDDLAQSAIPHIAASWSSLFLD